MRILFVIRSLSVGGAERQLISLANALSESDASVMILTFYDKGELESGLKLGPNLSLSSMARRGRWDVASLFRFFSIARSFRPDVIHGYMSGPNELCLVVGKLLRRPVVWGLRVSDQDFSSYSRFRQAVFRVGAALSRCANLIIANSVAGRETHSRVGYDVSRCVVIANGIDTRRFDRDPQAGVQWRKQHDFAANDLIVSLPARLDPMKDHATFLAACARLPERINGRTLKFVCVGAPAGLDVDRTVQMAGELGIGSRTSWLAPTPDPKGLYNASDVVCSSSRFGEGFSNVIGEAMACGRVCVATACGDSARIVGDSGFVVPVGDVSGFSASILAALSLDSTDTARLEVAARRRIHERFSVKSLALRTLRLLRVFWRNPERHR